ATSHRIGVRTSYRSPAAYRHRATLLGLAGRLRESPSAAIRAQEVALARRAEAPEPVCVVAKRRGGTSRRETPRSYAAALGRSLNAAYQRATFLHAGTIGAWENSANSSAARSVQSAIVGRSPATNGCAPMAASSTFRFAPRRGLAFPADPVDCFNRL